MQKGYGFNLCRLFFVLVTIACLTAAGCAKQTVKTSETAPSKDSPASMTKKPSGSTSEPAVETVIKEERVFAAEESIDYDKKSDFSESPRKFAGPRSYLSASGLRAGVADDNRQFNYFLTFLNQYRYVGHFPIDVSERILLKIKDIDGRPVPNARVTVHGDGSQLSRGKTYADGTFFYFPSLQSEQHQSFNAKITYGQDQVSLAFRRNGLRQIDAKLHTARTQYQQIPLDILFILDTTGSMGEEIERLKKTIEIINLSHLADRPIDQGEDYFQARKMDDERREETLQTLFDQAISQLVDYATVSITAGTPAAVIPIAVSDKSHRPDAEYFTEQLLFSFSRNKTFKAVERQDLQAIIKELQINLSGLVE